MTFSSAILRWYAQHRRELPWREPGVDGWRVLVSEVMLQQTPVARVLPVYQRWVGRWPTPSALAADTAGDAVRLWGRLGYPRRAVRLHRAAALIEERHDGLVPSGSAELRALPGVGEYTAAAVRAFAYRLPDVVLDTNVRRVLGRLLGGVALPAASVTNAERSAARSVLPADPTAAATWSVAVMELGALVCTAAAPRCTRCPVAQWCSWRAAGYPAYDGPPRRGQKYAGTDRQCRGRILALLRDADGPVGLDLLSATWVDPAQRQRALSSLLDDGLVVAAGGDAYALP